MKTKALWHIDVNQSSLLDEEVPEVEELVRIKSVYSFISQGTERIVASGKVPEECKEIMRVPYMKGDFSLPCCYGYSLTGTVHQSGHPMDGLNVHLMHPHQDWLLVNESSLRPIPLGIDNRRAVLVANMETALTAFWTAQPQSGDRVLISGFGSIGILCAIVFMELANVRVLVSEPNPYRKNLAIRLGLELWDGQENFELAINSSGNSTGLQSCIDGLSQEGKVVELSWYGNQPVSLNLGGSFHFGAKSLISSQVGTIPNYKLREGMDAGKRLEMVWKLLENDLCELILQNEIPFSEAPNYFHHLRDGGIDTPGTIICYD